MGLQEEVKDTYFIPSVFLLATTPSPNRGGFPSVFQAWRKEAESPQEAGMIVRSRKQRHVRIPAQHARHHTPPPQVPPGHPKALTTGLPPILGLSLFLKPLYPSQSWVSFLPVGLCPSFFG